MPVWRMRTLLLIPLLLIPVALTTSSLLIVRSHMQQELQQGLADDLVHSSSTFRNLEQSRRESLKRQAILLADQPSLRALMTTLDTPTIQNGGGRYARLSGSELFVLVSPAGKVIATYLGGEEAGRPETDAALSQALRGQDELPYVFVHGKLYEMAEQPIYFGPSENGSVLGYVAVGSAIDRGLAHQVAQSIGDEVAFSSSRQLIGSSLSPQAESGLADLLRNVEMSSKPTSVALDGEQYRIDRTELSGDSHVHVELIVLKSLQPVRLSEMRLNRTVLILGIFAFIVGGLLALNVAQSLTAPLEALAIGAHAIGAGDYQARLPVTGALEVRALSSAMDTMRKQISKAQEDLVEAERLATIGKMASSVSHDLRHYLASVYANAEFLAVQDLTSEDRIDLLADIQLSVQGTTDLIDSLLLFSHTGRALNKSYESITLLVERAVALLRSHPETTGVEIAVSSEGSCETAVDAKKVQRVLYNLILNACQATQRSNRPKLVQVIASETAASVEVEVIDSGGGVAAEIRDSLFEPFISANKENGVGIGLTLASTIAMEHGGKVQLESSAPGRTVFRLILPRAFADQPMKDAKHA
jgi:signal transduction histidine kinase